MTAVSPRMVAYSLKSLKVHGLIRVIEEGIGINANIYEVNPDAFKIKATEQQSSGSTGQAGGNE